MKKAIFLLTGLFVFSIISVKAQTYKVGSNVVSAGVGLGSSITGFGYGSQSPALSLQYERGVWEAGPGVVSLGGYIGYKSYKYSYSDGSGSYTEKLKYTIFGVRGAWHYTGLNIDNLDVYGGVMLSYDHAGFSSNVSTAYGSSSSSGGSFNSSVGFTAFVGSRYFFAGNLGGFAELGYGVSYFTIGLAYKF